MESFGIFIGGALAGSIVGALAAARYFGWEIADLIQTTSAARQRATSLDKANGVLRRELFELRATYEPTRNHGYGATHG